MATTTGGPFVLNIVELQNTINSAGGVNPVTTLTNTVAQLQEMIIFDEKRIAVNTISKYNQTPIQVIDSMNFTSNAEISVNGISVAGTSTTNLAQVSAIGYTSSFTNYYSTVGSGTAIQFQVGSPPAYPLSITGLGKTVIAGGLQITTAGTPTIGHYLTCTDSAGTAQWLPPGFLSDSRWKKNIRPLDDYSSIMGGLRGVRFEWIGGKEDVGFIAQEVAAVMPEAVYEGSGERPAMVEYQKIIPVLLEAIKGLEARVNHLEAIQHSK
jgi:hypothetical protein